MKIDFMKKVVVITGGTGGIGSECVKQFLDSNARVVAVDISEVSLEKLKKKMSEYNELYTYAVDIKNVDSISRCVSKIVNEIGRIEVLVQAAGILKGESALELSENQWDEMLDINAKGLFFMMREVVKQAMQFHGGSIINFSSMAGIRGMRKGMESIHYSASKGAVVSLTMQAATEWAEYNVRVNAVAPGGVKTEAMKKMEMSNESMEPIPLKKLAEPKDIANTVVFLASEQSAMITGQIIVIDGGSSIVGY